MFRQRSNIISVLDTGSSKVVCLVARLLGEGRFEILGIGHSASKGIRAGVIIDMRAAQESIMHAIESAAMISKETIKKVYLGVSSRNLFSRHGSAHIAIPHRQVNFSDINKLLSEGLNPFYKQNIEILHTFAYNYLLDGQHLVHNPIGMYCIDIDCDLHVIAASGNYLMNLANCLTQCGVDIQNYLAAAYTAGLAVLTEDEMEIGVILLELGASLTTISRFENGRMLSTESVSLGGNYITRDLAKAMGISLQSAERLKVLYGAVVIEHTEHDEVIELSEGEETMDTVYRSFMLDVVRARVEEIFVLVHEKIPNASSKIVITGGGARLAGLQEFTNGFFGTKTRIGYPNESIPRGKYTDGSNDLELVSALGMVLYLAVNQPAKNGEIEETNTVVNDSQTKRGWKSIISKLLKK